METPSNQPEKSQKGYLGNNLLKRIGQQQNWTQEQLVEMTKCMMDPIYFAENYIKIVHVDRGLIPLQMYDYQKDIATKIFNNRRVAVLTARQAGKTTTAVAIILHYIIFNEFKNVGILSNKGEGSKEVLERVKLAYENLPKWMQHGILEWNKNSIELENGCKVYAGTTTSSSIRGKSIAFLYIDECVAGDTIVTVRDTESGIIKNISIIELYDLINKAKYNDR
jgi:phage terminase large subunit-like protein